MKEKIVLTLQILVGLVLLVFGANIFLVFITMQPGTEQIGEFIGALLRTGYLMNIVGLIYILVGIAFVSDKFVPLMAVILMPVMLNAFLAHLFLDIKGIVPASFILLVTIIVMWKHRLRYERIFKV